MYTHHDLLVSRECVYGGITCDSVLQCNRPLIACYHPPPSLDSHYCLLQTNQVRNEIVCNGASCDSFILLLGSTVVSPYVGMARKQNGGYNASISVQMLIFHLVVNSTRLKTVRSAFWHCPNSTVALR